MTDVLIYSDLFLVTFVQALAWVSAVGVVVGVAWVIRTGMRGGR